MITGIAITPMYVTDQDEALTFYTQTLGLEVETDVDLGFMRWLTVCVPSQAERRILLSVPEPPAMDPTTAEAVRELTAKGATTWTIFHVDDCQATYDEHGDQGGRHRAAAHQAGLRHRHGDPRPVRQPDPVHPIADRLSHGPPSGSRP